MNFQIVTLNKDIVTNSVSYEVLKDGCCFVLQVLHGKLILLDKYFKHKGMYFQIPIAKTNLVNVSYV